MKHLLNGLFFSLAISPLLAQTAPPPAAHRPGPKAASTAAAPWVKLPAGVPPGRGIVKTAFSLRYQDLRIGTGDEAEPNKSYKVHYTGWLAADGRKFDSSYDRKEQVLDKDGKPELDADGKPRMEAKPLSFPPGIWTVDPWIRPGFYGNESRREATALHSVATCLWCTGTSRSERGESRYSAESRSDF